MYNEYSFLFERDVFEAIGLKICVEKRISRGGSGPDSVRALLKWVAEQPEQSSFEAEKRLFIAERRLFFTKSDTMNTYTIKTKNF